MLISAVNMLVDFKTTSVHYIYCNLISSLFLVEQKLDPTANFTRESVEPGTHHATMVGSYYPTIYHCACEKRLLHPKGVIVLAGGKVSIFTPSN